MPVGIIHFHFNIILKMASNCQDISNSQNVLLKLNDYQGEISTTFRSLRGDQYFTNVTLVCEDGQQLEAHKAVLAASSSFFQDLLKRSHDKHPFIYMWGMKFEVLVAILDFVYFGEVSILKDNVENFITIAASLKLKGLEEIDLPEEISHEEISHEKIGHEEKSDEEIDLPEAVSHENILKLEQNQCILSQFSVSDKMVSSDRTVVYPKLEDSEKWQELESQIKSMIVPTAKRTAHGKAAWKCQICGKEGYQSQIKSHVEVNHILGISLPCEVCEKTFRSRGALKKHLTFHPTPCQFCGKIFQSKLSMQIHNNTCYKI